MMYRRVGNALIESGQAAAGSHPTDWLLFLCPGKREAPGPHLDALAEPTEEFAARFRQTLRNPIYVHSKMLIVDDSYIIGTSGMFYGLYIINIKAECKKNLMTFNTKFFSFFQSWFCQH